MATKKTAAAAAPVEAVVDADAAAKAAQAEKQRVARVRAKRAKELAKDVFHQVGKVVVPTWFMRGTVSQGLKFSREFRPLGALALVAVGQAARTVTPNSTKGECEVGMQMKLRGYGFDRQEARDVASSGFAELKHHKLVRLVKANVDSPQLAYWDLSAKGRRWYEAIEKGTGCAPEQPEAA